jgi:hypothetical protein
LKDIRGDLKTNLHTGATTGTGGVRLSLGDMDFYTDDFSADSLDEPSELRAAGHVTVTQRLSTLNADEIYYKIPAVEEAPEPYPLTVAHKGMDEQGLAKMRLSMGALDATNVHVVEPAREFAADLARVAFRSPAFPVVANASGTPVHSGDEARRQLAAQLTSPVRWIAGVRRLAEVAGAGVRFVEVGPGTVLTGLARRILPACETQNLGTAAEVAAFLEAR